MGKEQGNRSSIIPEHTQESANELPYYPIHGFYNALNVKLARLGEISGQEDLPRQFNVFCAASINAFTGLSMLHEDLGKKDKNGKKGFMKLQQYARDALVEAGIDPDMTDPNDDKAYEVIHHYLCERGSPYTNHYAAAVRFNLKWKAMLYQVAGEKTLGNPPTLPSERVGWEWRVPGAAIVLLEGAGRINPARNDKLKEYEEQVYRTGDLRAIAAEQNAMIHDIWWKFAVKKDLSLTYQDFENLTSYPI